MAVLAIDGGPKVRKASWPVTGKRFGAEELRQLREALEQNTLFYLYGTKTRKLCARMAKLCGRTHAIACSSGSAAVHGAVKACGIGPGDEVVTSTITDAGTILGVVYEGGHPRLRRHRPRVLQHHRGHHRGKAVAPHARRSSSCTSRACPRT